MSIKSRLRNLERIMKPQDAWEVTALYPDGHTQTMTARQFFEEVKQDPRVYSIAQKITGNLKELAAWLQAAKYEAIYFTEHDDERLEYPDENEILKGEQDNDK